jgi:hypothetical protein
VIPQKYYVLIELVVFGTIALGIGFWQLWSVNRDIKRGQEKSKDSSDI